jgi:hypothetical protein
MGPGKVARLLAVATMLVGSPAIATAAGSRPDKIQCIAADTDGQSLRISGRLIEARKRFSVCASASCPTIVRDDCLERIAEVEVAQPTVVFTATNGDGRPVVAVRVTVDGEVAADRIDGRPLRVDPGEHEFVFEALGRVTTRMLLTLHEAEKKVRHAVVLRTGSGDPADEVPAPAPLPIAAEEAPVDAPPGVAPAEPPAAATTASAQAPEGVPPPASPPNDDRISGRRVAAMAAGGAGVLGVVLGSVFGAITIKKWNDATASCPGNACPNTPAGRSDQAEARGAARDGDISTIAFIAGGVGLAAGAWLWFAPTESPGPRSGVRILPAVGPSQGQLLVRVRF